MQYIIAGVWSSLASLWSLQWRLTAKVYPLPSSVSRLFVPTSSGDLELLHVEPEYQDKGKKMSPILFVHGGFGCAAYWIPWMTILARKHSVPVYAVSLRGHGASWMPSYFRLQYLTPIQSLGQDVVDSVHEVLRREEVSLDDLIVIGHSAGGGLLQYILNEGLLNRVKALALVAAMPNFGAKEVYWNWLRIDKWTIVRGLFYFNHARSALSNTFLVHRAFFCPSFPGQEVRNFETWLSGTESTQWPFYFMRRHYVQISKVVSRIIGWGSRTGAATNPSERLLIMAGGKDNLMTPSLTETMAMEYRDGVQAYVADKLTLGSAQLKSESDGTQENHGVMESTSNGVRFVVVPESGHHIQNDLFRETAVEALARWVEQL